MISLRAVVTTLPFDTDSTSGVFVPFSSEELAKTDFGKEQYESGGGVGYSPDHVESEVLGVDERVEDGGYNDATYPSIGVSPSHQRTHYPPPRHFCQRAPCTTPETVGNCRRESPRRSLPEAVVIRVILN